MDDPLICDTLASICVLHTTGSAGLQDCRSVLVIGVLDYIEEEHKTYTVDHTD